jgi:hypothetical protein
MGERTRVQVETESNDAVAAFLREYAVDAVDRLDDAPSCERFSFVVMGAPDDPFDRRYVGLSYEGDVEEIVEQERERWEALADDGPVVDWDRQVIPDEETEDDVLEEREEALAARLNDVETRISALLLEEFDDLPAPVDTYPDASPYPIGFWGVPHTVMHQMNYDLEDELDVYVYGIEHTLRNYAEFDSPERAEEVLDDVVERLEDKREAVRGGRLDS